MSGEDDAILDEMPLLAHRVAFATVLGLAVIAALLDHGGFHPLGATLLFVAITPWMFESLWCRPGLRAVVLLTPLAVLNFFGHDLGIYSAPWGGQLSLMLAVWVAGEFAATTRPRMHLPYAAAVAAIVIGRDLTGSGDDEGLHAWLLGLGVALAAGTMLRLLLTSNSRLRAAQVQLAQQAASEERARIAREVHDVVAHSLTVTMLHVTAARMALDRSPAQAREALEEAERHGRRSLADIRGIVGLLRSGEGSATAGALPGLDDIHELVAGYRSAGLDVTLGSDVEGGALTPAGELAAYRVVQEGLANVVKHAPGAQATVTCHRDGNEVVVEVADRGGRRGVGVDDGSGTGLMGMRERVSQAGGHLDFGPVDGGWEVTARIPVTAPSVDAPELAGDAAR